MVDALRESRRVLRPGGQLVDVRPLSRDIRVSLSSDAEVRYVGEIDESEYEAMDAEADRRMLEGVRRGWFKQDDQIEFGFHWYFDTLDDFVEYVTEQWEDHLDDATLTRTAELLAAAPKGTRIQVHKPVQLAWYTRLT